MFYSKLVTPRPLEVPDLSFNPDLQALINLHDVEESFKTKLENVVKEGIENMHKRHSDIDNKVMGTLIFIIPHRFHFEREGEDKTEEKRD